MTKTQITFADIKKGDKIMLEGGYTTVTPVTAWALDRIPEDAGGPYAGQWAWYFVECAPLVGQRAFTGETLIYLIEEDEQPVPTYFYSTSTPHKWSDGPRAHYYDPETGGRIASLERAKELARKAQVGRWGEERFVEVKYGVSYDLEED